MKPRLTKLLRAARAHERPEESPAPMPPGTARRLFLAAQSPSAPDTFPVWSRGLAWGCGACALLAATAAIIPRPEREPVLPEFHALAGLGYADETDPQP
jgi:hypothetical protein